MQSNSLIRKHYNLTPDDVARPTKSELKKYVAHINFPFTTPPCRIPLPFPNSTALAHYKKTVMVQVFPAGGYFVWTPTALHDNDSKEYLYQYNVNAGALILPDTKTAKLTTNDLSTYADSVRVVSAALRVSYIGRADEESGFFVSLVSPGASSDLEIDSTAPLGTQVGFLLQDDNAMISPISDGLCAKWRPIDYQDLNFETAKTSHDYEVAFSIQGTATQANFLIETVQTIEYIPRPEVGFVIPGETIDDPSTHSDVFYQASKVKPAVTKKEDDSWWNTIKNAVSTATGIVQDVSDFVDKAGPIIEIGASLL